MRRIHRARLSDETLRKLGKLSQTVREDVEPKQRAKSLWNSKPDKAFSEIREALQSMAPGRSRCMYCEDSQGTDIDHFWPKSTYPAGAFCWPNYLLACSYCNSNLKREQFPTNEHGDPLLLDPSDPCDDPRRHLLFLPTNGEFRAIGSKGQPSIDVFGLNDDTPPRQLPTARKDALVCLQASLLLYDRQVRSGDHASAERTRGTILRYPFSSVLVWLLDTVSRPGAVRVLDDPELIELIERYQVSGWLD